MTKGGRNKTSLVLLTPKQRPVQFQSMLLKHPLCIPINLKEKDKTKQTANVALHKAEFT